jgi:putative ABC transport system permease protein
VLAVTLRDLRFRWRQFAIAVIGAGVLFATALLLTGMANGFRVEAERSVAAVGADRWIVPDGATGPFTSVAAIPEDIVERIGRASGVEASDALVIVPQTAAVHGSAGNFRLIGHRSRGFGEPDPYQGRRARAAGEVVVDVRLGLDVGDEFVVGGRQLTVVGRVRGFSLLGGIPNVYLFIDDARAIAFGGQELATTVVTEGVPARVPRGYTMLTGDDVERDTVHAMKDAVSSLDNSRTLLWTVAAIIVAALMYVSALERTRDFAVLKALGSPSWLLFLGVTAQAILVTLLAAVVALVVSQFLRPMFPLPIYVPSSAYLVLPAVALGVGVLSSLVAMRRAVSVDPAVAFTAT